MRPGRMVGLLVGLAAGFLSVHGTAAAPADPAAPAKPAARTAPASAKGAAAPRVTHVTFGVRHRVFADFAQLVQVRMKEEFQVGDSPYTARAVAFVPDFTLDLETRKVSSLSLEPRNPAFKVIIREKGVPSDTAWAFLNMPPHFSRRSMLAFQVLRIEFAGHAPLSARDTTLLLKDRR